MNEIADNIKEIRDEVHDLEKRMDKMSMGAAQAAVDDSTRLGAAVRGRFEALEAIVGIMVTGASEETKERVRTEIRRRNVTWLH